MLQRIYRITALCLAFLMFFTSVGFAVDMHYCQGTLKSFSLLGKAKSCHELAAKKPTCHHHQQSKEQPTDGRSLDKKDCCNNKTLHFQADQDQQVQAAKFTLTPQLQHFITAYVFVFIQATVLPDNDQADFARYKPPLIPRDIPVLFETFLI